MRAKYSKLLSHFNSKRELCEHCACALASKHMTFPLDLMFCDPCFFQYQRQCPEGTEIAVTTVDRRPIFNNPKGDL